MKPKTDEGWIREKGKRKQEYNRSMPYNYNTENELCVPMKGSNLIAFKKLNNSIINKGN